MILFCDEINLPDMDHYGKKTCSFSKPFSYLGVMFNLASVTRHTIVSLATIVRPGYQTRSLCDDTGLDAFFCKVRGFEFFLVLVSSNHLKKSLKKGSVFYLKTKLVSGNKREQMSSNFFLLNDTAWNW